MNAYHPTHRWRTGRRCAAPLFVLLFLATGASALAAQSQNWGRFAVRPGDGIEFNQVDFLLGTVPIEDSDWGEVVVHPLELARSTGLRAGFLNVVTDAGWVVRDLYVQSEPHRHYPRHLRVAPGRASSALSRADQVPAISTYFDLGADSRLRTVTELAASVFYTPQPLRHSQLVRRLAPPGSRDLFRVLDTTVNAQGDPGDDGVRNLDLTDIGPPPPGGYPPHEPEQQIAPFLWVSLPHPVNIEAANNQCVPMAHANNLQFLKQTYGPSTWFYVPFQHVPGLRGDSTLVGVLDLAADRGVIRRCEGSTTSRDQQIMGIFGYLNAFSDPTRLEITHQGGAESYSYAGITSLRQGAQVRWLWLLQRLQEGAGVVLSYGRYEWKLVLVGDQFEWVEERVGGHMLRVYEVGTVAGELRIGTLDDSWQTSVSEFTDQCVENPGLRWRTWTLTDTDNDGMYNLSGTNKEVEFAMSIRVLP